MDVEWVGKEAQIEEEFSIAGINVAVGRIDRERFTVIVGRESEETKSIQELEVSILGRKFPKYDSTTSRTFLYIGEDENFLNTLSLNIGPDVTLYNFNTETRDLTEYEPRTLKRSLI